MRIDNIKNHVKKSISIYLIVFLYGISIYNVFPQKNYSKSKTHIYNYVYKNIIYTRLLSTFDLEKNEILNLFESKNSFKYLPDSGYYLDLEINKLNWQFPDSSFCMYSVNKAGWKYVQTSIEKKRNLDNLNAIDSNNLSNSIPTYIKHGNFETSQFHNDYLVAYNVNRDKILFISGDFFTHNISEFFFLNIDDPNSFLLFLKYKLHCISVEDIRFLKKTKRKISFEITYGNLNKTGYVELNRKDFDKVILHFNE